MSLFLRSCLPTDAPPVIRYRCCVTFLTQLVNPILNSPARIDSGTIKKLVNKMKGSRL